MTGFKEIEIDYLNFQTNHDGIPAILVDINEFSKSADDYYERAKNGERIFITVSGAIRHEVYTDIERTTNVSDESARPEMTSEQYDILLDIIAPLD